MKKGIAAVLAGVLVLTGTLLLNEREAVPVDQLRVVRIDCAKADREKCPGGIINQGDHCICNTTAAKGELADEVTIDKIPADQRMRKVLCCGHVDPETKVKFDVVRDEKDQGPIAPGCRAIEQPMILSASMHNLWTPSDKAAAIACCGDCPADCWVQPGEWGACPRCLCDNSCGRYCPKEEP